ncbi:MAG: excisionase family DNA-binding protein [Planctomycetota bacterium]|jgi:excisionase family DNA binding protein
MGKMYYSEEEAAHRLGVPVEKLQEMVEQGKLSAYSDGSKQMYRAAQVDALAPANPSEDTGPIELSPADSSGTAEAVTLSAADEPAAPATKEDTVITSEGISIFDDLEIDTDDPMAKTAVATHVDGEVMMEGVGGGSGLGRLAEEKDDTSLGPALDQIPEADALSGSGGASDVLGSLEEEDLGTIGPGATTAVAVERVVERTVEEELDPSAGAFSGLLLGVALLMLLVGVVVVPVMMQKEPGYLAWLQENVLLVAGVGVGVMVVLALAGYFIGKSAVQQAEALRRSR